MNDGLVGYALDALRETFFGDHADRLLLVDYGVLTQRPQQTMEQLYAFIGESPFAHKFDNVEYDAQEFDLYDTERVNLVLTLAQPVEAICLFPFITNDSFGPISGNLEITLGTVGSTALDVGDPPAFVGYVTDTPFSTVDISINNFDTNVSSTAFVTLTDSVSVGPTVNAPEPSATILLATGLVTLIATTRRRTSAG